MGGERRQQGGRRLALEVCAAARQALTLCLCQQAVRSLPAPSTPLEQRRQLTAKARTRSRTARSCGVSSPSSPSASWAAGGKTRMSCRAAAAAWVDGRGRAAVLGSAGETVGQWAARRYTVSALVVPPHLRKLKLGCEAGHRQRGLLLQRLLLLVGLMACGFCSAGAGRRRRVGRDGGGRLQAAAAAAARWQAQACRRDHPRCCRYPAGRVLPVRCAARTARRRECTGILPWGLQACFQRPDVPPIYRELLQSV